MTSKARLRDLERLNAVAGKSRHATPEDSLAMGVSLIVTDFTGPQSCPRGFAICTGDFGLIRQGFGDVAIRSVLFKSKDSTAHVDDAIRFAIGGKRIRIISDQRARKYADKFTKENN